MSLGDLRFLESFSQCGLAPLRSVWGTMASYFWMSCWNSNAVIGPALLHFFLIVLATQPLQPTTTAQIFANEQAQKLVINLL